MRIEDAFGENLSSFDEIDVRGTKYLKSFKGAAKAKRQALKDMRDGGFIKKESQNADDYINENLFDMIDKNIKYKIIGIHKKKRRF